MNEKNFVLPGERVQAPPQKPHKMRFVIAASVGMVAFILLLFLFSPYFHVRDVVITGNFRVSDEEILGRLELQNSSHLLLFNTRSARRRILENMYINEVDFVRYTPNRLYVNITERRLTAYIEHMPGSFLFLDDYGRVLEVRTSTTEPLPVLVGLNFTRFQIGEILEVPDASAFNVIVQYAQLLNHHGLIHYVTHINVSDTSNIRIIIDNLTFNVGGAADADEKVRTVIAIKNSFRETMPYPELIAGFFDVSDVRNVRREFIFEILQ